MVAQFRFRVQNVTAKGGWVVAEGESFEAALQGWHMRQTALSDATYDHYLQDPRQFDVEYFLLAWNEAGERFVSRIVSSPLRWKGGVRVNKTLPTKQELALQMGLAADALDGPWEGEETTWS